MLTTARVVAGAVETKELIHRRQRHLWGKRVVYMALAAVVVAVEQMTQRLEPALMVVMGDRD